ncbi:MAG: PAS domain-containing sensor histidine kinase [Sedimentisphaerales bacterium]
MNSHNIETASIEKLIERKRKNLEAIFDAIPVGLLLVDENLIVIRVNNAVRKMAGKDYSEIINRHIGEAIDCSTTATEGKSCGFGCNCRICPLRQNIQKVFETSQPMYEFEFQSNTHFRKRQKMPWLAMSIEPVTIEDKKYVVVCLNDITIKKLAEEKLAQIMEMKSQFISTVSHELRTPLTAIKEGLNIVLDGIAGRVKKKQKEFLNLASRNVDRLSMLINDVLDFQKLETGKIKFDFSPHKIAETVREAYETMKLFAQKNKIDLTIKLADDLGEAIFDHNRIIQVLTNLLSNAIKFTPQGGKVSLEVIRQQKEIIITVSDTGMGIPKEDLPKIFERFYRVKRLGKEIQGTGLGLPIVAQIISQHSGRILVESELNKGTTFTVYLPTNPADLDACADETLEKTITNE